MRRNADANAGDVPVLGKPLDVGVLSAALKPGVLGAEGYAKMLRHIPQLNGVGLGLAQLDGVHAVTDVTGFGLAGHLLEMYVGLGCSARIDLAKMPLVASAVAFSHVGIATGASTRNWVAYEYEVQWPDGAPEWQRALLTDPQTSGGLLASCSPEAADAVLQAFCSAGFDSAAVVRAMLTNAMGQGSSQIECV